MVEGRSLGNTLFNIANHAILLCIAGLCLLPLVHVIAVSFSDSVSAMTNRVTLWPIGFNLVNYQKIAGNVEFLRALSVSFVVVVWGTLLNLLLVTLTAYPLAISDRFFGKEFFKWFMVFAMLFSGGLIPWFLTLRMLGLTNNLAGLVVPRAVDVWCILIMITFFRGVPKELAEAAEIDGASHWDILFRVYVPIARPMLAAMTLLFAVAYWNNWFDGLVLLRDSTLYPLQTYLKTQVIQLSNLVVVDPELMAKFSVRAWRSGQVVVAMVPILVIYPFLQRYFVTMKLGGIKG
jgi:putative aldouronate transport system permease protein